MDLDPVETFSSNGVGRVVVSCSEQGGDPVVVATHVADFRFPVISYFHGVAVFFPVSCNFCTRRMTTVGERQRIKNRSAQNVNVVAPMSKNYSTT